MTRLHCALLALAALSSTNARAQVLPDPPAPYDALLERTSALPVAASLPTEVRRRFEGGHLAHVEERLGLPTFFWAPRGQREGNSLRGMGLTAAEAARRHLFEWGALYHQAGGQLAESTLQATHDTGRGAIVVSFRKEVDGLRVFRDALKVVMDRELELVALAGYLPPHERAELRGRPQAFNLGHATAVAAALGDLTGLGVEGTDLGWDGRVEEGYHHFHLGEARARATGLRFSQPARARAVWFTLPEGLVPAYYVELDVGHEADTSARSAGYVLSAHDGALLFRKDHVAHDAFGYRVWTDADGRPWDGPQGTAYSPHPTGTPNGQQPVLVPQSFLVAEHGPISTGDPWLLPGATVTRGNNVDSYADLATPDGFGSGDIRSQVTSADTFDYAWDPQLGPQATPEQINAAVTMLFVANNWFHDWYYDAGFDELAGNAQTTNFGRGGLANDSLRVEAQDYSGTDNANMYTPGDGARPRMQMYIFRGAAIQRVTMTTQSGASTSLNAGFASFGPSQFDVTAEGIRTQPTNACSPITNGAALLGKIAVIDRGTCTFVAKAKAAQDAGAIGVVIANNTSGGAISMPGTDPTIVIPTQSVSQTSGNTLKGAIAQGPVTVNLFRQANPDRDGTLDLSIVAHEWGHYISNRLIGDANGLNNTQGVGMGEGWSDFHTLLMVVREEDAQLAQNAGWRGVYPMSTFVTTGSGGQGLYFGIRRLPYSIDFTKNALTFKHIQNGVPLPTGVPTAFGSSGNNNAEVHATGEVWATMLWEVYAALLNDDRFTFEQAQDRMKRYLVAGYKATPNSPTFTEARDAILAAALAEDTGDFELMWKAFARRGIGLKAVSPNRTATNNAPVVEDFGAGNAVALVRVELDDSVTSCDQDGLLDTGETGHLTVTIRNAGSGTLTQTTVQVVSETPGVTLVGGDTAAFGDIPPLATVSLPLEVKLVGPTDPLELRFAVTLSDPDVASPPTVTVGFRGNVDEVMEASTVDDVESENTLWTATVSNGHEFQRQAVGANQHQWFGPNAAVTADFRLISPTLTVANTGDLVVTFRHRYDLEKGNDGVFYDGAVLELQVVGTAAWMDIGNLSAPGYDGALAPTPSPNPLRGRPAWSGKNPSHPGYDTVTVNLGTDYAGQNVRVRFRAGSDGAVAHVGWELDDIGFEGIIGTPFPKIIPQLHACGNASPVVDVGADLVVDERSEVVLTGLATDADGDLLTLTWTQLEGPPVTLTTPNEALARFVAPEVEGDTALSFELAVTDGIVTMRARQNVLVKNVNRRPVAVATAPDSAGSGDTVTLDGTGSHDPDGDPIASFQWVHLAGPAVSYEPDGATATFVAPQVDQRVALRFGLVVSDGALESEVTEVEVFIEPASTKSPRGCGCSAGAGAGAWLAPGWLALAGLALRRRRRQGA